MSEIAELLERAAGRLESTGWIRGTDGPETGPNCLNGAIHWESIRMGHERKWSVDERARACIEARLATAHSAGLSDHADVISWNDSESRKAAEVIDALKNAAKDLRNLEVPA